MTKSYTAIVFFPENLKIRPRKYRNITRLENFLKFAQNSGGLYVNLYSTKDKKFEARKWLRNDF